MVDAKRSVKKKVLAQPTTSGRCHICGSLGQCWTPAMDRVVTPIYHEESFGPPHWDAYLLGCRCHECHEATLEMVELFRDD